MVDDVDAMVQAMELAEKLSDEDLRVALDVLSLEYRQRLKRAAQLAAAKLKHRDVVVNLKPGRKLPAGARGHVTEIRSNGKLGVHFEDRGHWLIDATLVRKVETGEATG